MTGLPGFDADWYARTYSDVLQSGLTAAEHYRQIGARLGRPPRPDCTAPVIADHAVIVHAYHLDCLDEISEAVARFPPWIDIYVSYPRISCDHSIERLQQYFPYAKMIPVENVGQDIGAFLQVMDHIEPGRYEFFCKLHSKKGDKYPTIWREALIAGTVGSAERIDAFVRLFRHDPEIMIGGARELFLNGADYLMENRAEMNHLLRAMDLPPLVKAMEQSGDWGFFAGSMLWIRRELAERLHRTLDLSDFYRGEVQRDGQSAHAVERLLGLVPGLLGQRLALASCCDGGAEPEILSARVFPDKTVGARPMMEILQDLHGRGISAGNQALLSGSRPGLGFTRTIGNGRQRDFSIVTPTGDRMAAFNRCAVMVASQTIQPREWIVVDDGVTPLTDLMPLPEGVRYVRRPPAADDPPHTLARNILTALNHITTDRVLIMEDDDWYSPLYAEYIVPLLDHHEMIGINQIRYYHLSGCVWKNGHPPRHTAFAQTAFRRGHAWDHLATICRADFPEIRERGIIDRHWWQTFEGTKILLQDSPGLHVGLKGGFGRRGLASGHERREVDYMPDPDRAHLQSLIGCDLSSYARWTNRFRKPYAVYTTMIGSDICAPPPASVKQADFFVFTDRPDDVPAPWIALPLDGEHACVRMRTAKPMVFPHLYFPEYEWSFWTPATGRIPENLDDMFARHIEEHAGIAIIQHAAGRGISMMRQHNGGSVSQAMMTWWNGLWDRSRGDSELCTDLLQCLAAHGIFYLISDDHSPR